MTIYELNDNLEKAITTYQHSAGQATQYCSDDSIGDALYTSQEATAKVLATFKNELLAYLSQQE